MSKKTHDRSLENRQLQLTAPPIHFAQKTWRSAEFTSVSWTTLSVSATRDSRESTAVSTWVRCVFSSLTRLTRIQRGRFSARRELSIRFTVLVDVQFKISQKRFTSLIPKCSLGNAAVNRSLRSCVMLAFLISIQPGTSSTVSRCI